MPMLIEYGKLPVLMENGKITQGEKRLLINYFGSIFLITKRGILRHPSILADTKIANLRYEHIFDLQELWDMHVRLKDKLRGLTSKEKAWAKKAAIAVKKDPIFYGLTKKEKSEMQVVVERKRLWKVAEQDRWNYMEERLAPIGLSLKDFSIEPPRSICHKIERLLRRFNGGKKLSLRLAPGAKKLIAAALKEEEEDDWGP